MTHGDTGITWVLAAHPLITTYVAVAVAALATLAGIAIARPRVFAAVLEDAAIENRLDRRLLLGAMIVAWSAGWPISATVLAVRAVRRRR